MQNPALHGPIRRPRYPIVLCYGMKALFFQTESITHLTPRSYTGLYGFDARGPSSFPSLRMQYWSNVLTILRKTVGAEVIVTAVPGFVLFCSLVSGAHN